MPRSGQSQLRKGRYSVAGQVYHVVSRTHGRKRIFAGWIEAVSACRAFTSSRALQDSRLLCYALMPDHAHWLVQLGEEDQLAGLVARMKSLSAKAVRSEAGLCERVWHRGFYDRAIRREEDLAAVARYIVANPLRAALCTNLRQYPFWDAVYL
ncbi:MAG: transposase [Gammaproteobacteria bacterium]|nr:transposase [Gammaproteobacteria bacterium]